MSEIRLTWRSPFTAALTAAIATTSVVAAVIHFGLGGHVGVVTIVDLGEAMATLLAAIATGWRARLSEGQIRRAWALMCAYSVLWGAGQSAWAVYEVGFGAEVPFPSIPYLFYMASLPLAMASVIAFWPRDKGAATQLRAWLDGIIVFVALMFIAWPVGLKRVYLTSGITLSERALGLLYPLLELVILTILLLAVRRATRQVQGPVLWLLAGLAALALTNLTFIAQTANNLSDPMLDIGWVISSWLIALAALWPVPARLRATENGRADLWQLALPWMTVVAVAATVMVILASGDALDPLLTTLVAILMSLLVVSQVLAHADSEARLQASRQSEALLTEMVKHARRGIATVDRSGKIVAANPGLGELLGAPFDSLVGKPVNTFIPLDNQPVGDAKMAMLMNGEVDSAEVQLPVRRADGRELWVGATGYTIRNSKNEVEYVLAYLEDLTSRHAADELARQNLTTLEHLNDVRTQFIRSISHEFKTGLFGIQGYSELLRDGAELGPGELKEYADGIFRSTEHLNELVNEMIELNNVEASPLDLAIAPLDLNEVVSEEAGRLQTQGRNVAIVVDLVPDLVLVKGDRARLAEAVGNLLRNALKYSPEGGRIEISTAMSAGEVMVSVRDDGVGLRADFDSPLYGENDLYANNPIRKVVGVGLGLGITRRIVEMHGGRIWMERLGALGTVAHITIPAVSAMPGDETRAAASGRVA